MKENFLCFISLFLIPIVVNAAGDTDVSDTIDQAAVGQTICAGKVVPITSLTGVLYKSENVHGGRGPTWLVKNVAERTHKKVIEIRNARCEVIGSFGMFAEDGMYGDRYYTRTGGSGIDAEGLVREGTKVGSYNILVEGVNGKWIRVKDPRNREGAL